MRTDDHDLLDRREVALDRVEHGHELLAHDQHLRLRVVDDVRDLGCGEPPVHRDVDGVDLRPADQDVEVLRPVLVEEGDPVLRVDALGEQGIRHAARALVQLAVGDAAIAHAQRNMVTAFDAVDSGQVGDARDRHLSILPQATGSVSDRFVPN